VKKKMVFKLMSCLLLSAFTGCHKPVKGVVLLPDPKNGVPAIYAEAGGSLEFKSEAPEFVITWTGKNPCEETELAGSDHQSVTCTIPKNIAPGTYTYTVDESHFPPGQPPPTFPPPIPPFQGTMYIRPCPRPCYW
jgi:hypothetical protein